uniref:Protein S-acyltransferase n=1 Tax=Heterorhabditis bacteriophora TaxID=37862 RepID=A0A1I7WEG6_HETBA
MSLYITILIIRSRRGYPYAVFPDSIRGEFDGGKQQYGKQYFEYRHFYAIVWIDFKNIYIPTLLVLILIIFANACDWIMNLFNWDNKIFFVGLHFANCMLVLVTHTPPALDELDGSGFNGLKRFSEQQFNAVVLISRFSWTHSALISYL